MGNPKQQKRRNQKEERWEYCFGLIESPQSIYNSERAKHSGEEAAKRLNDNYGNHGWELCGIIDNCWGIFKKRNN